ncbi:hypothetical protein MLD38_024730 [Melastoma candidum]|uniref:Uncharacterized protein n=1 Tax=Melastoma candidum TaxID=119954 RepID=A0ACB9P004_9MYRT|nr:hypothetical protein MLD38_024730 [Melastoma candidum]
MKTEMELLLQQHHPPLFLCEEKLDHETGPLEFGHGPRVYGSAVPPPPPPPPTMPDQDSLWDPQELPSLLSKQEMSNHLYGRGLDRAPPRSLEARDFAVDWIMKVHAFFSFSAPTAVLAVDILDRFLNLFIGSLEDVFPWMTQLTAVACLSLAAKVEETRVPLLLDFQVEGSHYVFEAKTIQRMEVVVLSSLQWRMNPVTPLSFLDFALRRFGFKDIGLCWAFRSRFEKLLLSVLPDCRSMGYIPSVLAAAIMLHILAALKLDLDVIGILGADKEYVHECYKFVWDSTSRSRRLRPNKRKFGWSSSSLPVSGSSSSSSPSGVMEMWCSSSSDSSDNSCAAPRGGGTYLPEPNRRRFQSPPH